MSKPLPEIKPGQVWADCDWRQEGRTLEVVEVVDRGGEPVVVMRNLTDRTPTRNHPAGVSQVGRTVRVKAKRMRPISTGFRLVEESA